MESSVLDMPDTERSNFIKVDAPVIEEEKKPESKRDDQDDFQIDSSTIKKEIDQIMNH